MICVFVLFESHSGLVHQYITDVCAGTCLRNFINHVSFNKIVVLVPKNAGICRKHTGPVSADPIVLLLFTADPLGVFPEYPNVHLSTDLRAVRYPAEPCVTAKAQREQACQRQLNISFYVFIVCQTLTCTQPSVIQHPVRKVNITELVFYIKFFSITDLE